VPLFAFVPCWVAWLSVRAFYEEIARLCCVHGLNELVPYEWRHER
jgi:hypothetical protein